MTKSKLTSIKRASERLANAQVLKKPDSPQKPMQLNKSKEKHQSLLERQSHLISIPLNGDIDSSGSEETD
tara:strand:+ start:145 stop:354 length:210 start_codon:yes stop_codon:yes gene_type:complete